MDLMGPMNFKIMTVDLKIKKKCILMQTKKERKKREFTRPLGHLLTKLLYTGAPTFRELTD